MASLCQAPTPTCLECNSTSFPPAFWTAYLSSRPHDPTFPKLRRGVLMIDTTSFPREFVLDVGPSLGMNTETTFQDRLSYEGGSLTSSGSTMVPALFQTRSPPLNRCESVETGALAASTPLRRLAGRSKHLVHHTSEQPARHRFGPEPR